MAISPGSKFGSYEILSAIGAGGMGQVYLARDSGLRRDVAVKVLSDGVATDADRLARFEREAHVLASLNHPNIAAVYGLERVNGTPLLIMELVPGQTLAERLTKGAVPMDEALPIAAQIAAALEAAHDKGIVHRDLKPANVIVTPEGQVKVLDFGLAKHLVSATGSDSDHDLSRSPTMAAPASAGLIVGTAAYMSPEQARGKAVDRRTDLWSFGCVLYEMLAGAPAFAGETLTDVLAAVINQEPAWSRLPAETPAAIRGLLRRCLQRNPGRRLQHAGDARIEIEEAIAEPSAPMPVSAAPQPRRSVMRTIVPWTLTALLAIALAVAQLAPRQVAAPNAPVTRVEINMPAGIEATLGSTPSIAISPDGERLAFTGSSGGLRRLYVRRFDEFESTPLRGTETANICIFSPDGRELAFISSDRVLRKVSLADGLITTLTRDAEYQGSGATWGADGYITFVRSGTLWRVPSTGEEAQQLTSLDDARNERLHFWPAVVEQSHAILFTSIFRTDRTTTRIEALSLATGKRHVVVDDARNPHYTASGHLLFFRNNILLAAPFDANRLEVTGPAVAVLENISLDQLGSPMVSVSNAGALAYIASGNSTKRMVWVSRQGIEQPISDVSRPYQNPRLSPDGGRIVVEVAGGDLWIQDLARATFTRLTSGATIGNTFGAWAPDGRHVVYRTLTGLYEIDTDGGGESRAIPNTLSADIPASVSPDGQTLAFIRQMSEAAGDVYTLTLGSDAEPRPIVKTSGYDGGAQFSPDGHWLAYVSNESGAFEVNVRPYPGPDRKTQVSTQGGTHPRWNRNGKEIFYRTGNKMMVVDVSTSPALKLSTPRVLFEQRYTFGSAQTIPNYDVSPDGQRFLMVKDESSSGRLNIILNWFDELTRLAPSRP